MFYHILAGRLYILNDRDHLYKFSIPPPTPPHPFNRRLHVKLEENWHMLLQATPERGAVVQMCVRTDGRK